MRTRRIGPREPHYLGYRDEKGRVGVFRIGHSPVLYELALPVNVANGARGFDWGNTTASAELLSVAILTDYLPDIELAARFEPPIHGSGDRQASRRPAVGALFRDIDIALKELMSEAV
jgi:hypothetical protein